MSATQEMDSPVTWDQFGFCRVDETCDVLLRLRNTEDHIIRSLNEAIRELFTI